MDLANEGIENMDYSFSHEYGAAGLEDKVFESGLVVARNAVDEEFAIETGNIILDYFHRLVDKYGLIDSDNNSNSMGFIGTIEEQPEIQERLANLARSPRLLDTLEELLGPDISANAHNSVLINHPSDSSLATNKALHQEFWTGQVSDDLSVWVPLTPVDKHNTLYVVPGSHFYGTLPNRNRKLLPIEGFEVGEGTALTDLGPGDAVIFHFLLLHGTVGRSDQTRIVMVKFYKPTYTETSMRLKSHGVVPMRRGALTKIRDVLGNDAYTPLRVYGGPISNKSKSFDLGD